MSEFFRNYPKINYNIEKIRPLTTQRSVNILTRVKIRESILSNIMSYYPYVIKERERPDTLSYLYYGSVSYTWLILIANDIIDPYYDWPLFGEDFDNYIKNKYVSIDAARESIHHYEKILTPEYQIVTDNGIEKIREKTVIIDKDTYDSDADVQSLRTITNYEYEVIQREKKRNIILIDEYYVKSLQDEFRTLYGN